MSNGSRSGSHHVDRRQHLGLEGETWVGHWLSRRGWTLEARRFRVGRQEIDLVVRRGSLVAFVEVKTRQGRAFGRGREAVGWRKQRAIARVAEGWRLRHGRPGDLYRFDVVEVSLGRSRARPGLVHIEDAWRITE